MKLHAIEAGNFKLDGGAMFGVVPKTIWNKTNPADENNLIDIDSASEEAVGIDGIAHFISYYDGKQIDLDNGVVAYRIN